MKPDEASFQADDDQPPRHPGAALISARAVPMTVAGVPR